VFTFCSVVSYGGHDAWPLIGDGPAGREFSFVHCTFKAVYSAACAAPRASLFGRMLPAEALSCIIVIPTVACSVLKLFHN
jgi:hypothetical protein